MSYYDKLLKIETLAENFSITNAQEVKAIIDADTDLEREFFRKVHSLDWFRWMEEQKYFNCEEIQFDKKGNALFWGILDYLERVSEQIDENPDYGKDLIVIIDSIVQFSVKRKAEKGEGINNYHIWWYCVKMLNNLSPETIRDKLLVDKFRSWLSVWTDHSMASDLSISDIGGKLLSKFFKEEFGPEYRYAEAIIEVITKIKVGGKGRRVTKREDAVLAWDSYWIRKAFDRYASLIGQKCSVDVLLGVADKLKKALEYKQKEYHVNIGIGDDVYQIRIARQPADGLKQGEIAYEDGCYKCLVKQFSQDQLKNIDRENDFWALHNTEPQNEVECFILSAVTKETFTKALKEGLPKDIKWESADNFEKKLNNIYDGLYSDYSNIWCRSLKNGPEHGEGAEDILTVVLRDILTAKCQSEREVSKKILELFLSDKYQFPIFRRFVLLCIDKFWNDYSELLDKFIAAVPNVLEESDFEVEMQDILQHHNAEFNPTLKAALKELINRVPEYYVKKEDQKLIAYWKYKWLSPLRENQDFSDLYEHAKQETEPKDGKPYEPERSAFKGGFVTHKSPISTEEIIQKPITELVNYLNKFKGADFWQSSFEGEPDKKGLVEALRAAVKDAPKKFTDEIHSFINVDYSYLHSLFRGFNEAWNSNKGLDWKNIFDFVLKYFSRNKEAIIKEVLQAQGEDSGKGKYIWLVEDIVDLIENGSKDDKHAFGQEYFATVKQIFDLVIPLPKSEKHPDTERDAVTYALNTTFGRIVMSFIIFSLRAARATKQREQDWGKNNYQHFFDKGAEAYIWFGRYLPNLRYLDKTYVDEKITEFSKKDIDNYEWQIFMEGYLTGGYVYKDIYEIMRPNYFKALQNKMKSDHADNRLVQHITIGYLGGREELKKQNRSGKDSLMSKMLGETLTPEKRDRWLEVVSYFWSISGRTLRKGDREGKGKLSGKEQAKILEFWWWSCEEGNIEYVKTRLDKDYGAFLGRLAELTLLIEEIDGEAERRLMLSAPYIDEEHRSGFFIEYLTKFEDEGSIRRIGNILTKILEYTTPTFKEEEIKLLVKRLFELGKKYSEVQEKANNICNTYGRRGLHFLKDLWIEYNK